MNETIGTNAGAVWCYLNKEGKKTCKEIKQATKLTDKDLFTALGWLARENKIEINKIKGDFEIILT